MEPDKNLDWIINVKSYFEPLFKGIDGKLTEISDRLQNYSDELYKRTDEQQGRLIKLEERQVGWTRCVRQREECHIEIKGYIKDFIENYEIIKWAIRVRRISNYIIAGFIVNSLIALVGWLLYIYRVH